MTPWLSAIVPVHRGARYLGATLAAAAAERPEGVEFLLYDSGPDTESTRQIAASFADRLTIRYAVTAETPAWTAKTNRGVRDAGAPRVVMLHQDDLWLPGHLQALKQSINDAPQAALSIGPSRFIDATGRDAGPWRLPLKPGLREGGEFSAVLIVQNTVAIPSPMIRRDAWLAAGGMDEALWYTADWDLYLKLAAQGPVHVRPGATTGFRIHGGSLTMTGSRDARAFREQLKLVVTRHLDQVPAAVRNRQARLARAAIAVNCALAAGLRGGLGQLAAGFGAWLALGPAGWWRFMDQTRLWDRLWPRLRLSLAGGL